MTMIACPVCGARTGKLSAGAVWGRCQSCGAMVFRPVDGPRVLIVHDSEEICAQMGAVLLGAGLHVIRAGSGRKAQSLLDGHDVSVAVLDVGLTDVLAFELIERIHSKPELQKIKVVLVASVFNKTAYKRRPSSLYGADDYVEQHHIPDMLPQKVRALLGLAATSEPPDIAQRVTAIQEAKEWADLMGADRVRAMAKSIVGDIALYHEEDVQAARSGSVSERLGSALNEGRQILDRVADWRGLGLDDPIQAAFDELLAGLG